MLWVGLGLCGFLMINFRLAFLAGMHQKQFNLTRLPAGGMILYIKKPQENQLKLSYI